MPSHAQRRAKAARDDAAASAFLAGRTHAFHHPEASADEIAREASVFKDKAAFREGRLDQLLATAAECLAEASGYVSPYTHLGLRTIVTDHNGVAV